MKSAHKAILASVLVLALCLSAVGGVTYSWFTDEESTEVDVTAGQMKLITSDITGTVQSYGGEAKDLTNGEPVSTDLGGTVTMSYTAGADVGTITVNAVNGAPGDIITLNFKNTINNNIDVNYYVEDKVVEKSETPLGTNPFTIFTTHTPVNSNEAAVTWASEFIEANAEAAFGEKLVIQFNESAGNQYQGRAYSISVDYNLVQGNIAKEAVSNKAVKQGTESEFTVALPESDVLKQTTVEFPEFNQDVKVTVQAISDDPLISLNADDVILGGIDVSFVDANGDAIAFDKLTDESATVTMTINGEYDEVDIIIYHDGSMIPSSSYDIDFDGTNTIITIKADAFSPYTAVQTVIDENAVVKNITTGVCYKSLEAAIAAVPTVDGSDEEAGEYLRLLDDVTLENDLIISSKAFALDMYGHSISVEKSIGLYYGSDVAFVNGTIYGNDEEEGVIPFYVGIHIKDKTQDYTYNDVLGLLDVDVYAYQSAAICAFQGASVVMFGGSINSEYGAGIITNGTQGRGLFGMVFDGVEFNIERSVIDDHKLASVGVQVHQSGIWGFKDCTFNIDDGPALSVRGGIVTIKDCYYNFTDSDEIESGKIQYSDVKKEIDIDMDNAIAVYYKTGTYGYGEPNVTKLTIDGELIEDIEEGEVRYIDLPSNVNEDDL